MDHDEFRSAGKQLVDYIVNYMSNIRDRPVVPNVQPGYLHELVGDEPPEEGVEWSTIFKDIEPIIMKGMTHWHSPRFHAYFPTANSYPAICGDMLSAAVSCIGFNWNSAPSCTELEMKMMDWLAKMLGLPEQFQFCSGLGGGGVIQTTASESTLIALLGARSKVLTEHGVDSLASVDRSDDNLDDDELPISSNRYDLLGRMVAYASSQSHSSVEKAAMLSATRMRLIPTVRNHEDRSDLQLDPVLLESAIVRDRKRGLIPHIVIATLGSTNTCAFDDLEAIGKICEREKIWLHVDSAYAASAFVCPEYRHLMKGVEYATSFTMNPHKWLLVNFDCNAFWVKDKRLIEDALTITPAYLKHDHGESVPDYRNWQIPLGRRFRSLKMWFVFRSYGIQGLQEHIRKQIGLANYFAQLLSQDDRFELFNCKLGLVCFRIKGSNEKNKKLIDSINSSRLIMLTETIIKKELFLIRFAICARYCEKKDVDYSWNVIQNFASYLEQN